MKQNVIIRPVFLALFGLQAVGCAHSTPEPTRVYQFGDRTLTCVEISEEANLKLAALGVTTTEESRQANANLTFWILGQIALIPMLGMDVSGAGEVERTALIKRVERLRELSEQ